MPDVLSLPNVPLGMLRLAGQQQVRVRYCILRDEMEIEELSIPLPYYNSVLSFLYANPEEEQDSEELNEYLRFKYR